MQGKTTLGIEKRGCSGLDIIFIWTGAGSPRGFLKEKLRN